MTSGSALRTTTLGVAATAMAISAVAGLSPQVRPSTPIRHIIVIYQENHSFDNVLGLWCAQTGHCDGMPALVSLKGGVKVVPTKAADIVAGIAHNVAAQTAAIDGGLMDGWAAVPGCGKFLRYQCVSGYAPSQIPNLISLASNFAISERTFSEADSPSWGGHLYAVAATTDGFIGDNPTQPPGTYGLGWGCDSKKISAWMGPGGLVQEPSCIPDPALPVANGGAFEPTPVSYVPTIMDRLGAASLPWRLYATVTGGAPSSVQGTYIWATCPSFAECLDTTQHADLVPTDQILSDAAAGKLPAFGLVLPGPYNDPISAGASQHNGASMAVGDNWIGKLVGALEASREWSSTAVFITYDDCGCFYDHVTPGVNPDGSPQGIRVPLVIVSPYAIRGFVDTTPTTFAGILAYVEQTFGLAPLSLNDASAYAFGKAFNYAQLPLAPVPMHAQPLSATARAASVRNDGEDPT